MITAVTGTQFEATSTGATPGLVGTITFEVYDPTDGTGIVAPRTSGITEPRPGTYRTADIVATAGSYMVRWTTPDGVAEEELIVGAAPTIPYTGSEVFIPVVGDVAAYLRARTKTVGGQEAGTFNSATVSDKDETRPTAEQVTVEIANAMGDLLGIIGTAFDPKYNEMVRRVGALRAALLIELAYYPEQVATGRSPYIQLKELYDELLGNLYSALGIVTGEDDVLVPEDAGYPSYGGFPTTAIGMEMPW